MKILSLSLENYKSFRSSGPLSFSPSFTIMVGKNNAGKSALLEAFRLVGNGNHPHRSLSHPRGVPLNPQSSADFDLSLTGEELMTTLLEIGSEQQIPIEPKLGDNVRQQEALKFFDGSGMVLSLRANFTSQLRSRSYPSHGRFQFSGGSAICARVRGDRTTQKAVVAGFNSSAADDLPMIAEKAYPKSIFVFRAERLNLGKVSASEATVLKPDGSNLAAVLGSLQGNTVRFEKFNKHVREIFPTIRQVSVAVVGSEFEVRIWSVDPATEREDLGIALQESGTGVGQVLAILYVAMTVRNGVIVIDEPNSFLHPGAAKKLIQILRQYDQHQYVLATHSAELIATAKPEVVHLVRWENGESKVEQIDVAKVEDLRDILLEIGVSFSDLFGYDRAIWVEGPTEEICFPLILEKLLKRVELGLVFVAVRATGDFEKKRDRTKLIWEIYEKVSAGALLLPTAVSFSFDREDKNDQVLDDLRRQSKGLAHFIPRLTYENYLLIPDAMAALVNSLRLDGPPVTAKRVTEWLQEKGGSFLKMKWNGDIADPDWLANVHAPTLLKSFLYELAGPGDRFEKTSHSKFLTQWLIDNRPAALAEIAEHIATLADKTR